MGRQPIPILLKITSKDDKEYSKPVFFKSIPEAAVALGFSERGVRKACQSKQLFMTSFDGIVYDFKWLDPKVKAPS